MKCTCHEGALCSDCHRCAACCACELWPTERGREAFPSPRPALAGTAALRAEAAAESRAAEVLAVGGLLRAALRRRKLLPP